MALYELSIEGIKADPKASVPIDSWSWGAASPSPDPSMPGKKQGLQTQDLYVSIEQSDASPLLLEAMVAETV